MQEGGRALDFGTRCKTWAAISCEQSSWLWGCCAPSASTHSPAQGVSITHHNSGAGQVASSGPFPPKLSFDSLNALL